MTQSNLSIKESARTTRPEIKLLLYCTRTHIDIKTEERIKKLLQQDIDWTYLIQTSACHGVIPLLYQNLNATCSDAVPKSILSELRNFFHTNAHRNLFLTQELFNLLDLFQEHDILAIPFKGSILAVFAYGNLALRQFSDLDILVREQDILRAQDLLIRKGYEMKIHPIDLADEQKEVFLRSQSIYKIVRECAYSFIHYQNRIMVDLHWTVMPKYFSFPIDSEQLWENVESIFLMSKSIPILSPEDTLLTICGHGAKETWRRLARICDVAALIHTYPQMDWERVIEKATKLRGQRILFLGLALANVLLDAILPESVWFQIKADLVVERLTIQIQEQLFPRTPRSPNVDNRFITSFSVKDRRTIEKFYFWLSIRERMQDKCWFFFRIATTPTGWDWALLPLVEFPLWVYYLIRPIHLGFKYGLIFVRSWSCGKVEDRRKLGN